MKSLSIISYRCLRTVQRNRRQQYATSSRGLASLAFQAYGAPDKVLSVSTDTSTKIPSTDEIKVKFVASPVTSSDIRTIRGLSLNDSKPGVAGLYGIGTISEVGSGVTSLSVNDVVFVSSGNGGTWSDFAVLPAKSATKLPSASISPEEAGAFYAGLSAWPILNDFAALPKGATVVQSHPQTAVGQAISSIGASLGLSVIDITEKNLEDAKFLNGLQGKSPLLAIAGSSKAAAALSRILPAKGTLVAYNGPIEPITEMSPVPISASRAIFEGVSVSGFELSYWLSASGNGAAVTAAAAAVAELIKSKKLKVSTKAFPHARYAAAIPLGEKDEGAVLTP